MGGWRRLLNEELHNLYVSPDILRVIKPRRMSGAYNAYGREMSPLRRPRRRWEDNIKMFLGETGWEGVDWVHLARDMNQ
jgi:hypothetical protein